MKSISEPFIKRPVMTTLLALSIVVFGIICYFKLPVCDLPNVDYPVIQVYSRFPGMNATTMASAIATPLEKEFLKIQGIDTVTSSNTQGFTSILLQFTLDKNIDAAATDVQSAIQRAMGNLPSDLPTPPVFDKNNPNSQPIFYVALTSDTLTSGELYDYANDHIAQRFSIIKGVSKSDVHGAKRAIRINVDVNKLYNRGLTILDVSEAIRVSTASLSAGKFQGPSRCWILRPEGQLETPKSYEKIIISNKNNESVFLRDIATCETGLELDDFSINFWSKDTGTATASIIIAVTRSAGANTVEVAKTLRNLLPEIRRDLPDSVNLTVIEDRSLTIIASIKDVEETVLIAFVLVTLVIFFFLGRIRDTIIPLVALPLSIFMLFIGMYILGFSLDNLSLMGITLAVGFLVDDAIVFLENMVRRMHNHGESPEEASIRGGREISSTIVSMTLSLASIFIPLVFMGGQIGRVFHEFSMVIIIATLASGVVSLSLTPLMCARMLKPADAEQPTRVERLAHDLESFILKYYSRALYFFLNFKSISLAIWLICLAGTAFLFIKLPKTFLPEGDSGIISGLFIAQEGTSLEQMKAYQKQIDNVIQSCGNIRTQATIVGIPIIPSNQGLVMAFLKPANNRNSIQEICRDLTVQLAKIPGAMTFIRPIPSLKIDTGVVGGNQGKYSYTISGVDTNQVYSTGIAMLQALRQYDALASVSSDMYFNTPELKIKINRDQISTYGLSVLTYENQLKSAYSENYIYLIKAATQQYPVIVTTKAQQRANINDLDLLYFHGNDPIDPVQATTISEWSVENGLLSVNHTNNFPSVTLYFDLKPDVAIGDAIEEIEAMAKKIIPSGMIAEFQGEAKSFSETFSSLKLLLIVAIFVTYVILGILYESYIHPITVLSSLPVAMVGGLATLLIFHQELSLYAYIGLFMLLGLVEKNAIMIIDFALQRQESENLSPYEAIHKASMQRFRPIMMTTLAMVMGVLPIALGWGADGASRRPLGLVVIGGMIFAQLITLFITPAIYLYMDTFQTKILDRIPLFKRGARPSNNETRDDEY